jgi:hypothetical protein
VNLRENLGLGLDVQRIAPIHGSIVTLVDLKTAIGEATD